MTEVPKELVEKVMQVFEKARSSGKIKKGINEVTKAVERGKALIVAVAVDVDPKELIMHIPVLCDEKDVVCVMVPSKQELGAAMGLQVGCSSGAILEAGDAKTALEDVSKKL
ncbi:MAG TPA: 50S ribosomal protein L7ae, partial [archaeon]|nr:50S ribosomal protein L7ae [archaeon]